MQIFGDRAFKDCFRLVEVVNNSALQFEIGSEEYGCIAQNAKLIISADGTKTYKDGEFIYIDTPENFRFLQEGDQYTLVDYNGNADIIELPASINGSLYEIYFTGNTRLKTVIVPEGITEIGKNAFSMCSNLVEVILPDSILTIGDSAFMDCIALEKINIPSNVTEIPYQCFRNCSSLGEINIPNGITYIGDSAFEETALKRVIIPDSVTYIRNSAFYNCVELTSVYIGSGLNNFSSSTFSGCPNLNTLEFSSENNYFTSVNNFVYDKNMTSILFVPKNTKGYVDLPSTLATIGTSAFA